MFDVGRSSFKTTSYSITATRERLQNNLALMGQVGKGSAPAKVVYQPDLRDCLAILGDSAEIVFFSDSLCVLSKAGGKKVGVSLS
jgi:hypothetical protein